MSQAGRSWFWGTWSRLGLGIALATLIADQVHKWWMLDVYHIQDRGRVVITPFLDLVFVLNRGISYGLFAQHEDFGQWLLSGFAVVAAVALVLWLARDAGGRIWAISLGLLIGGAIGNAIDRVRLGGVADFFSMHAFGFYWYVFNIADVAIVAGVLGLLYDSLTSSRNDASKAT
jgi:signal peptidase II